MFDFDICHCWVLIRRRPWQSGSTCVSQLYVICAINVACAAAHIVVIKGVKLYQNGETKEYSDLEVLQMMGRAVSPSLVC